MNTIELYLISVSISIIWFDVLYIQTYIKKILGYKEHDFIKPFDCRYCTFHHLGLLVGLVYFLPSLEYIELIKYALINYALTNIITKQWD